MPNKMLIDASHPEETRVVVLRGNRIEEFDFESQDKKQLRGNIYLARVTRVEPSLQAAFVEYGGNRHGFLAFSEIHPDYYQIPVADRQALLQAEAAEARAEEEAEDDEPRSSQKGGRKRRRASTKQSAKKAEAADDAALQDQAGDEGDEDKAPAMAAEAASESVSEEPRSARDGEDDNGEDDVDTVGAEDALDEAQNRRRPARKNYKIQEVIKRRQILLVQVVKEERGNKGAALTTYLSLAGRYSVLMPNTARGGGISRKITNVQDRKRLKDVVRHLDVPEGMGVILRTAGANRTKVEVKRDYDYLMRLWEKVRSLTLESIAPSLVYEEGSLIKRSVRDLYNKDIDEILVSGEDGYREAKDFMRMLMPSHAKSVQPYREVTPIFAGSGIEAQLDRMLQPQVTLKSGGYIIINQTEALVAIDVNSGRSTKEHSIEDTALQTNLEAAEEVARQLRLRDMAGLIVIDFIDMEENRNNRAVEKRLKDCLKNDRARIQVGRISHFGLLEMSRQRIRASVLESTMQPCPHCGGTGHIRSESSVALYVARSIEEYLLKDARNDIAVRTPTSTALYLLNHKRANLVEMEGRFGVSITVEADDAVGVQHFAIVKQQLADKSAHTQPVPAPALLVDDEEEAEADAAAVAAAGTGENEDGETRKRRRKRKRRGGRNRNGGGEHASTSGEEIEAQPESDGDEQPAQETGTASSTGEDGGERKKRHRGRRGGRRNRRDEQAADAESTETVSAEGDTDADGAEDAVSTPAPEAVATEQDAPADGTVAESVAADTVAEDAPASGPAAEDEAPAKKPRRRTRKSAAKSEDAAAEDKAAAEPVVADEASEGAEAAAEPAAEPEVTEAEKPKRRAPAKRKTTKAKEVAASAEPVVVSSSPEGAEDAAPRKTGWWQRKGFF
ncbi:ribonuclease E/G [Nitratireductor pacificus]|uniref:Ribonuclease E n=1 Tax=Nitratireductor pacificus pht-3B TaxID=391937 RepID=K2LHT7_9HYPH|nr:ribonuclease E/G [Nitratireductor pacificus]EKF17304.1 ribonuclease E [Nitratireductor pacificus pht-3B]